MMHRIPYQPSLHWVPCKRFMRLLGSDAKPPPYPALLDDELCCSANQHTSLLPVLQLRRCGSEIGTALHGQVMTLRQRLASAQKQLTQRESQMDGLARSMSATRRRLAPGEGQESSIQEGEMERQLAILVQVGLDCGCWKAEHG